MLQAGLFVTVFLTALASSTPVVSPHSHQQVLSLPSGTAKQPSPPGWSRLSWEGLHVNTHPSGSPPRYLTLSLWSKAQFDPSSVVLHIAPPLRRSWGDVTLRCKPARSIESCRDEDLRSLRTSQQGTRSACRAANATPDGRSLFDPTAPGCEPLADLWEQSRTAVNSDAPEEILLSLTATLSIAFDPLSSRPGVYERDFWLAHLSRARAAWPLSNASWRSDTSNLTFRSRQSDDWASGSEPNRILGLMTDTYLPRTEKPKRNDVFNGVDVSYARWNLGVSLRLPPPPSNDSARLFDVVNAHDAGQLRSTLQPVHSPIAGQVVYVDTYRRLNAPVSGLNDERGWVISIQDEWGFVWHLLGISPYHQHVHVGQRIAKGKVVGHVSLRPFINREPRDRTTPADPPEKPPGGDGNPRYPYWTRELRIGVARPSSAWTGWRGPYDDAQDDGAGAWTWYNPLHLLSLGASDANAAPSSSPPPPLFDATSYVFFARPAPYPPTPPTIFSSASLTATKLDANAPDGEDLPEISGNVELIVGLKAFTPGISTAHSASPAGLDPVSIYKLEWAVIPLDGNERTRRTSHPGGSSCAGLEVNESLWRTSFEHAKVQHGPPGSYESTSPFGDTWDDSTTEGEAGGLWKYLVPAFTTGHFAWTRQKYGSQFDWKDRNLYYPLTRTVIAPSAAAASSSAMATSTWRRTFRALGVAPSEVLPAYGSWDTRLDSPPGSGRRPNGDGTNGRLFYLAIRATDSWGGSTCVMTQTKVRIRN